MTQGLALAVGPLTGRGVKPGMGGGDSLGNGRITVAVLVLVGFMAVVTVSIVLALAPDLLYPFVEDNRQDVQEPSVTTPSEDALHADDVTSEEENEEGSDLEPVTPSEAYADADVVATVDAQSSADNLTEAEVLQLLEDRGFETLSLVTRYEIDGIHHDEQEVSAGSSNKHPTYEATYVSEDGDLWQLLLCNGQIAASPLSHNDKQGEPAVLISETGSVTSYYSATDTFYVIVPDGTDSIVKTVERIDAETLDSLSDREIDRL